MSADSFEIEEQELDEFQGQRETFSQNIKTHFGPALIPPYRPPGLTHCENSSSVLLVLNPRRPVTEPRTPPVACVPSIVIASDALVPAEHEENVSPAASTKENSEVKKYELSPSPAEETKASRGSLSDHKPAEEEDCSFGELRRLIFSGDYSALKHKFAANRPRKQIFRQTDACGNTLLFLAVRLCPPSATDQKRVKIVRLLMKYGANPLKKNADGWSLLDVAVAIKNRNVVRLLYEAGRICKVRLWKSKREEMFEQLVAIPDFYLEIKWDFRSSMIPFLSYFTPSDTYKIWKMGSSLRLDFSFLGFNDENKSIKSDTSLLMREGYLIEDAFRRNDFLIMDRKNKSVVNPFQTPDEDEREEIVSEILDSQPVQGDLTIADFSSRPSTTIFGRPKVRTIHGRVSQKYKLKFDTVINSKTLEDCSIRPEEDCGDSSAPVQPSGKSDVMKKTIQCGLYTSHDFPLKLPQVLTVVRTLAKNNSNLRKLKEYLSNRGLQDIIANNGFPIRLQVPMGYSVYAVVTFTVFKYLNPEVDNYQEIFSVPADYNLVSRRDAFQCVGRNKRIVIANLNI